MKTLKDKLKASAAVVAASVALCGCDTAWNPFGRAGEDPIRVATYNIRLATGDKNTPNAWADRRDDLVDLVRRLDLDAGGLQEVRPEQMSFLRERLPEFEFVGEHRGADRVSDEASPVFYRKSRFEAERSGTFWRRPPLCSSNPWCWNWRCGALPCSWAKMPTKADGGGGSPCRPSAPWMR